jgi:hypothetical protein
MLTGTPARGDPPSSAVELRAKSSASWNDCWDATSQLFWSWLAAITGGCAARVIRASTDLTERWSASFHPVLPPTPTSGEPHGLTQPPPAPPPPP